MIKIYLMSTFPRLKLSSMAQKLEFDPEIPEKFWSRRPRLQGQAPGGWEPVSTQNGTVTIRTQSPVPAASDVYIPGIAKVRIAQFLPEERILVVEHRLSLTPPRSIYAAYFPIRLHREWLNLTRCSGANPDCLSSGEWVGATGSAGASQPEYFYVRFSDRAQIGRSEFRPELRAATTPPRASVPSQPQPRPNLALALARNRYWGVRLGWQVHIEDIARLLHAAPDSANSEAFIRLVADWQRRNGLAPDGIIGPQTWQRMQRALGLAPTSRSSRAAPRPLCAPPSEMSAAEATVLALTTRFETGVPYGCAVSATDGISMGMLQWNLLAGTLQTLLDRFENKTHRLQQFFGPETERLHRLIALRRTKAQRRQAVGEARAEGLASRWREALLRLCADPQFCGLLIADAQSRLQRAQSAVRQLRLRTVRGLSMMFDIVVGDGLSGNKLNAFANRLWRRQGALGRPLSEQEKLREIAEEAARHVGVRVRQNRLARRLLIANGSGRYRRQDWNLDRDFPNLDRPWE